LCHALRPLGQRLFVPCQPQIHFSGSGTFRALGVTAKSLRSLPVHTCLRYKIVHIYMLLRGKCVTFQAEIAEPMSITVRHQRHTQADSVMQVPLPAEPWCFGVDHGPDMDIRDLGRAGQRKGIQHDCCNVLRLQQTFG